MTEVTLAPTNSLKKAVNDAGFYILMNKYMDNIAQTAVLPIDVTGMGDAGLEARVSGLSTQYVSHMSKAKADAVFWVETGAVAYVECLDHLKAFGERFADVQQALQLSEGVEMESAELTHSHDCTKKWKATFDGFSQRIERDRETFAKDLKAEKATVGALNHQAQLLREHVARLRQDIKSKSDEVGAKGIDGLIDAAQDGGEAALELVGGRVDKAIESCAKIAFTTAKYEVEGIILGAKSIEDLRKVEELTKELSFVDEAMMLLEFVGEHLKDLSQHGSRTSTLVDATAAFFEKAQKQVSSLKDGSATFKSDPAASAAWSEVAETIGKVQLLDQKTGPLRSLSITNVKAISAS